MTFVTQEAELLIAKKIHPQTIISGWRKATQVARDALREAAVDHRSEGGVSFCRRSDQPQTLGFLIVFSHFSSCSNDIPRFHEDLMNISRTTLSSKLLTHHKDHFSRLAVDAVLRLKGSGNLEAIHIIKKLGGSLTDSYLDEGMTGVSQRVSWLSGVMRS